MRSRGFFSCVFSVLWVLVNPGCSSSSDDWIPLFDGKSLDGWHASENPDSFRVEDGAIVCNGPRSHLFYVGIVENHDFRNFELSAEIKTTRGSNSGIYFHTGFQDDGWPSRGYEAQILNSHRPGATGNVERKLTGSLYGIRNVWKAPVGDDQWFEYHILVQGKTIQIRINGELVVDYTEPPSPFRLDRMKDRVLSSGTFALQCHDPGSTVLYQKIKVRPLSDSLPSAGQPLTDQALDAKFTELAAGNIPLIDLHSHLKGGLTLEDVLEQSRTYGITYGIAVNCGLDMTLPDQGALREFLEAYYQPPQTYLAMQAEGREWLELFSKETISEFDYVFTDSMTWTNDHGKRMRLWIKDEVEVGDPEQFMDMLVGRVEQILSNEPIDIYVNPTYLPDEIADRYEKLWTADRMDRVINALVANGVALEINSARRIPSPAFLKRAKAAGVKFTFGTNNGGKDDLGLLEYSLEMVKECGLEPSDMWVPAEDTEG